VTGTADLQYLADAVARAGGPPLTATELTAETLLEGRTGSTVTRLIARGPDAERRFVLKAVPAAPWRVALGIDGMEARLWLSGTVQSLPAGLRCPTLDVARHSSAHWWILMDDVSSGIVPRGTYDEAKSRTLMRNLARAHARFWAHDDELAAFPIPGFEATGNAFATLAVYVGRGATTAAEPWLAGLAEDFWVCRALLPPMLNAMPASDADFYLDLCANHSRIAAALAKHPHTLLHGDLRRANISVVGDDVALFDWELSSRGPATRDLAWHMFTQWWAYPPAGEIPTDRQKGLAIYVDELERARGTSLDRAVFEASYELGFLSVLCQVGFCLGDPFTDANPSPEALERARRTLAEAIGLARQLQDRHVR